MEPALTAETCDKCKSQFDIEISDFEQTMKDRDPILCPDCHTAFLDEQTENMPRRVFEYNIAPEALIVFDELGAEGWELVAVYNGYAYFKRERFEST